MTSRRARWPVQLVALITSSDPDLRRRAQSLLTRRIGEVAGSVIAHEDTSEHSLVAFERLVRTDAFPQAAVHGQGVELTLEDQLIALSDTPPPAITLAYLERAKVVTACAEDAPQRIYIGDRIYASPMLHWDDDVWHAWPWTPSSWQLRSVREALSAWRATLIKRVIRMANTPPDETA